MPEDHSAGGPVRILAGLGRIAADYDGFILDLWGVLHDGAKPFPGVLDALGRLIAAGKRVVILSNAPRRAPAVIKRMGEIGIPPGLYHHVLSSGEETWQHLVKRDDPFHAALGTRCYHIGSPRDEDMVEGVGFHRVKEMSEAVFILNTGPWDWNETLADY
jgi:HAD superfamily hydrolase (TIGR01459 family)